MEETIILDPLQDTVDNIYNVPKKQWNKWNYSGKQAFNQLMHDGTVNRQIYCATDSFGTSPQIEKILDATVWNLAWDAAKYVTKAN